MNLLLLREIVFYTFCFFTLVQVFYYLFFFLRLAIYRAGKKTKSQTYAVSVIICARDEAANLAKNLPGSLLQQYSTTHEVIVVDDNSFDDTRYLLEEFGKEFKQLHVVELKQEAPRLSGHPHRRHEWQGKLGCHRRGATAGEGAARGDVHVAAPRRLSRADGGGRRAYRRG